MQIPDDQATRLILNALAEIPRLKERDVNSPEFKIWLSHTKMGVIAKVFGAKSIHVQEFDAISYRHTGRTVADAIIAELASHRTYIQGLADASYLLTAMLKEVNENQPTEIEGAHTIESKNLASEELSNRIFVVHGRDDGAKDSVARFLSLLGLEPVILQEMPNNGRTIIEKFEDFSDVGFAIVLCTPDDVGALASETDSLKRRPRQNVIFEWGFFVGKLGRGSVAALIKDDEDGQEPVRPSDYDGVMHYPMRAERQWKMDVLKELQSAGYDVDANRIP